MCHHIKWRCGPVITVSGGGACHHIEWRCGPVIIVSGGVGVSSH